MCLAHIMNEDYSYSQPYKMQATGKQGYTGTTSRHEAQSPSESVKNKERISSNIL